MKIKIKKLHPDTKLPAYALPGDVGMDLYALEDRIIKPKEHVYIMHGFALEFAHGYGAFIKDKSSISKAGLHTMGGVFDAEFRGEYNTHLVNLSEKDFHIEKGMKVSQLVILPVDISELEVVEDLTETQRGSGSFGSTGKF